MLANSLFPFLTPDSYLLSRANDSGKQPQITQCCEPPQERQRATGPQHPQPPCSCPPARALSSWLSFRRAVVLSGKSISQRASVTPLPSDQGQVHDLCMHGGSQTAGLHLRPPSPLPVQPTGGPPSHLPLHTHFCTAPQGGYRVTKSLSRLPRITPVGSWESTLPFPREAPHPKSTCAALHNRPFLPTHTALSSRRSFSTSHTLGRDIG